LDFEKGVWGGYTRRSKDRGNECKMDLIMRRLLRWSNKDCGKESCVANNALFEYQKSDFA